MGRLSNDHELAVENLHKDFAGTRALAGVSLSVESGSTLGLIGPNGSGKTTLVNAVSGIVCPDRGRITLDRTDLTRRPPHVRARVGIARTFQNIRLFREMTVVENCELALLAQRRRGAARRPLAIAEVLELLGLVEVADVPAGALPYGRQRKAELARAAVTAPSFLLLDEPAAGMNEHETAELVASIRLLRERLNAGIVVVEHDLALIAALCDVVEVLDAGVCISRGTPQHVRTDPAVIEAYIGSGPVGSATRETEEVA